MIFGDSTEQTGSGVFLPSISRSNDLLLLADFNETLSNEVTVCDLAKLTCLILKKKKQKHIVSWNIKNKFIC